MGKGFSLRVRIIALIFLFSFFPLTFLGLLLFKGIKADMVEGRKQNLSDMNMILQRKIDAFTYENLEDTVMLSRLPESRRLAAVLAAGHDEAASAALSDILYQAADTHDNIEAVFMLHPRTGEIVASSVPYLRGMFFNKRPYFALGKERPLIYPVHYSFFLERSILATVAPVWSDGELSGVMVSWINIKTLEDTLRIASGVHSYLVTRGNLHVSTIDQGEGNAIRSGVFSTGAVEALKGNTASAVYEDAAGQLVIGAYALLETLDLALLVEVPFEDVLKNANEQGKTILGLTVALGFVLMILSVVVGNRITRPIRTLIHGVRAFGHGSGETQPIQRVSGDEVIELSSAFTQMMDKRREAEDALLESRRQYRDLVEYTNCIHWELDYRSRQFTYVSPQVDRILGYPDLLWRSIVFWYDRIHEEDRESVREVIESLTGGGTEQELTYRIVAADGRIVWIRDVINVYQNETGPKKLQGIMFDITGIKSAEGEILRSLHEKEMLLREVHHRVKNNMQVISSLLKLQSGQIRDTYDRQLFRVSQDRIRTLAMVHELLYRSEDLTNIDFHQYIKDLASNLFRSYTVDRSQVSLRIDVARVEFSIDTAVPLGLLINEVLTNSFKHGFTEGRSGEILIRLSREQDDTYVLLIRDTGAGIRQESRQKGTLGLQLVESLSTQLRGEFSITSPEGGGTEFSLRFREPEYQKRY